MKFFMPALLAAVVAAPSAFAAETIVPTTIDAVDLHLDGAEVTRTAHWSLKPGDSTIVVLGLSRHLVDQSLRVSGLGTNGISIRSVLARRETSSRTSAQSQALLDEQADLNERIEALKTKQRMIQKMADMQQSASTSASATPDYWPMLWSKVADSLEETSHRIRETEKRLDVVTAALTALQKADATPSGTSFDAVIEVSADQAVEGDLKLTYQVTEANWQPLYDARLRTEAQPAKLDLSRRARVMQSTGEDWTNVALTLSTSSLTTATKAPILRETSDVTGDRELMKRQYARESAALAASKDDGGPILSSSFPLESSTPYDATLPIPERVSVTSDSGFKLFSIDTRSFDVDLSVRSAPLLDKRAYLQAGFESTDRVPLVPGVVELYRDGSFVGQSTLEGTEPGERITLGFGADDLVSVERSDVRRKEANTTVTSGVARVERAFKTVVTNRHPFPIRIELDDREPAFNNVAIVLKESPSMTPPTDRQVDGHRGVLAWTYTYAPGETRTTALAWVVRWPAKLGPIHGYDSTQYFRFDSGATF